MCIAYCYLDSVFDSSLAEDSAFIVSLGKRRLSLTAREHAQAPTDGVQKQRMQDR